jgi:hypothetical protein
MGIYVNPRDGLTKEAWLAMHGDRTLGPCEITAEHLPVCLVDNGLFTAAGVAYTPRELEAFQQPDDLRPK